MVRHFLFFTTRKKTVNVNPPPFHLNMQKSILNIKKLSLMKILDALCVLCYIIAVFFRKTKVNLKIISMTKYQRRIKHPSLCNIYPHTKCGNFDTGFKQVSNALLIVGFYYVTLSTVKTWPPQMES